MLPFHIIPFVPNQNKHILATNKRIKLENYVQIEHPHTISVNQRPLPLTINDLLLTIALRSLLSLWQNKESRLTEIFLDFSRRRMDRFV